MKKGGKMRKIIADNGKNGPNNVSLWAISSKNQSIFYSLHNDFNNVSHAMSINIYSLLIMLQRLLNQTIF